MARNSIVARLLSLVVVLSAAFTPLPGMALTVTWDWGSLDQNNSWNDPLNWSADALPTTTDDVELTYSDILWPSSITLGGDQGVRSLLLNSGVLTGISGANTLTVQGGGANLIAVGSGATDTTTLGMTTLSLMAAGSIDVASGKTLAIDAAISGGTFAIQKTGAGTLALGGSNTLGAVTISGGTIMLNSVNALGNTAANTMVTSGGTLDLNGQVDVLEPLVLNGAGVGGNGALINSNITTLASQKTGTVTLGSSTSVGGAGDLRISGVISGAAGISLTKVGAGKLILAAANTWGSTTTNVDRDGLLLNAGVVEFSADNNLGASYNDVTFAGDATLRWTSTTGDWNPANANRTLFVNSGVTGTLEIGTARNATFNDANQVRVAATGTLVIKAGTGNVYFNAQDQVNIDGTVRLDSGTLNLKDKGWIIGDVTNRATVSFNGGTLRFNDDTNRGVVFNTRLDATSTIISDRSGGSNPGITHVLNGGTFTVAGDYTLNIRPGTAYVTSGTAGITIGTTVLNGSPTFDAANKISPAVTTVLTLGALNDGGVARIVTKTGDGILVLNSAATSLIGTSEVRVQAGELALNSNTAMGSAAVTVSPGGYLRAWGAARSIANPVTAIGDLGFSGTTDLTLTGTVSIGGGITNANSGMTIINAANAYTGMTTLRAGALQIGTGLPADSFLALDGGVYQMLGAGPMTFDRPLGTTGTAFQWGAGGGGFSASGGKLTVAIPGVVGNEFVWGTGGTDIGTTLVGPLMFGSTTATDEMEFTHGIDLNGATRVVSVTDNPALTTDFATMAATIRNSQATAAGLTKQGTGVLVLAADNPFDGTLTFAGGTVRAASAAKLGTGDFVFNGGGLQVTEAFDPTVKPDGTTPRPVTIGAGGGTLDMGTFDFTPANPITGTGPLTKVGTGLWTLNNVNTWGVGTTVSGGGILVGVAGAMPDNTALTMGAGTSIDLNNIADWTVASLTFAPTESGPGSIVNIGAGKTLTVNGGGTGNVVVLDKTGNTTGFVVTGDGSFVVDNPTATFKVGVGTNGTTTHTKLDMSGLANFTADVANFDVGRSSYHDNSQYIAILAQGSTITANEMYVGYGTDKGSVRSWVHLGAETALNVNTIYLGRGKNTGDVLFQDGLVGPSITIRGKATDRADMILGWFAQDNSGTTPTGTFDLTNAAGTGTPAIDIKLNTLTMARMTENANSSALGSRGNLLFNTGVVDVNNAILGETSTAATQGSALATITIGGGTLIANNTLTLAERAESNTNMTANGTVNLNAATATIKAKNIKKGTLGGNANINWNAGTITHLDAPSTDPLTFTADATATTLLKVNVLGDGPHVLYVDALRSVVFQPGSTLAGAGTLTKEGAGTLSLYNDNALFTGDTRIVVGSIFLAHQNGLQKSTVDLDGPGDAGNLLFDGTVPGFTLGGLKGARDLALTNSVALSIGNNDANTSYTGALTGNGRLIKVGAGTLTLGGVNTYNGTTTVSAGVLSVDDFADRLGTNTDPINLGSGATEGTLQYTGPTATFERGFAVGQGGGAIDFSPAVPGETLTVATRGINLAVGATNPTFTVKGTGNTTIASAINVGIGTFKKTGPGTATLTNAGNAMGTVEFNAGAVEVDDGNKLGTAAWNFTGGALRWATGGTAFDPSAGGRIVTFSAGGATFDTNGHDVTVANPVGNAGTGGLAKIGAGTLTLAAANTYSGPTAMNGGVVSVTDNAQLGTTGGLSFGGGTLQLAAPAVPAAFASARAVTLNAGGGTIQVLNPDGAILTGQIAGAGDLTKSGSGMLTLSGPAANTGTTYITEGVLKTVGSPAALPGLYEGFIDAANNWTTANPKIGDPTAVKLTTVKANSSAGWGDNDTWVYSGYIVNPTGANAEYTLAKSFDDGAWIKIDGTVVLNSTTHNALVKANVTLTPGYHTFELRVGNGTGSRGPYNNPAAGWDTSIKMLGVGYALGLDAPSDINLYQPFTDPGGGTFLVTGMPTGISMWSPVVISAGAALDVDGNAAILASLEGVAGSEVHMYGYPLSVGANGASTTFAGTITGDATATFTKIGAGTLTLSGANGYAGTTLITAGTIALGADNALPATPLTINGATAALDLGADHAQTVGTVTLDGGGQILGTGTSALTSTATFEVKSGTVSAVLTGDGIPLNKTTAGTVTLNAVNAYTGATTVNGGTLVVNGRIVSPTINLTSGTLRAGSEGALPDGAAFTMLNGSTLDLGNATSWTLPSFSYSPTTAGAASITGIGLGKTLSFTGAGAGNTFFVDRTGASPGLTISGAGSLVVDNPAGDFRIDNKTAASANDVLLDMRGLASFTANVAAFDVANSDAAGGATRYPKLYLAASNTITATMLQVGVNTTGGTNGVTNAEMWLGAANTLHADTFNLGLIKNSGLMKFAGGLDSPAVTIRGTAGGDSRANLTMGRFTNSGSGTLPTGTLDLSNAAGTGVPTVDARFGTVILGSLETNGSSAAAGPHGILSFNGGSVDLNDATLARTLTAATAGLVEGVINVGGSGTLVVNNVLTLAERAEANANTSANATINLNNAAATIKAKTIQKGARGGTATINWNAGTITHLDAPSAEPLTFTGAANANTTMKINVTGAGPHNLLVDAGRSAQVLTGAELTGTGTLTKTGDGTLTLAAPSTTFTGDTRIAAGSIVLTHSSALAGSTLDLDAGDAGTLNLDTLTSLTLGGLKGSRDLALVNSAPTPGAIALTVGGNNQDTTYAGVLSETVAGASLTKIGSGALTLTAAQGYTGPTNVTGGTLRVNGSLAAASAVTFGSGTTLAGSGTILGPLTVAADTRVVPGAAPLATGTLTVPNLSLAGNVLDFDLSPAANDKVLVNASGGLSISGGAFNLYDAGSTNPYPGLGVFQLFGYSGALGGSGVSSLGVLNPWYESRYDFSADGAWVSVAVTTGPTWNAGGTTNLWSEEENWGVPTPLRNGDALNFNDPAAQVSQDNDLDGMSYRGMYFKATAGAFTLTGKAIGLGGDMINSSSATQTINLPVNFTGAPRTINAAAGPIAIGGPIHNGGNLLTITGDNNVTVDGAGTIAGAGGLTKSGAGTLTLNTANAFGGETRVTAGALVVGHSQALQGTTLDLNGADSGTVGFGALANVSLGGLKGSRNLDMGARTFRIGANGATTEYSGVLSGVGAQLVKEGTGALTLSGVNAYDAGTTVTAGRLAAASPLSIGAGPITLSGGTLGLGGFVSLIGFGGNGTGWDPNGTASIATDVLTLTTNAANQAGSAFLMNRVNPANGFTATFTYTPSGNRQADATVFILHNDPRGSAAIGGTGGAWGYSGITPSLGIGIDVWGIGGTQGTERLTYMTGGVIPGSTLTIPSWLDDGNPIDVSLTYDAVAQTITEVVTERTNPLVNTVTQVWTGVDLASILGGKAAYVGFSASTGGSYATHRISELNLTAAGGATYANTATVTPGAAPTIEVLAVGGGNTITMTNIAMGAGSTLNVAADAAMGADAAFGLTINAVTLDGDVAFSVANNGAGLGTLTLGDVNGGAFGITKAGAGQLILAGAKNYTGTTTIADGSLDPGATGLPDNPLVFSGSTAQAGTLDVTGTFNRNLGAGATEVQWTGGGGFAAKGGPLAVQLNGGTAAVTWGAGNFVPENRSLVLNSLAATDVVDFQNPIDLGTLTGTVYVHDNPASAADYAKLSGALSGSGNFVKSGPGLLVMAADNSAGFTGGLVLNAGTVKLDHASAIGPSNVVSFGPGSTAKLQLTSSLTIPTLATDAGSPGSPIIENAGPGPVTLTLAAATGTATYAGIITNGTAAVTVAKTGTSTLILTGGNSDYSGGTTIEGTVMAGGRALGTGAVAVPAGARLQVGSAAGQGLLGEYYNIAPYNTIGTQSGGTSGEFTSLATVSANFANRGQRLLWPSWMPTDAKTSFNFGRTTAGFAFPPPYTTTSTNLEVRWSGKINIPVEGDYTLYTASDDGSMLFLDGEDAAVVGNNYFQGYTERAGTKHLAAGLHDITIAFYQGTGDYGMSASIAGPGIAKQYIPTSMLSYTASNLLNVGGLNGDGLVELGDGGQLMVGSNDADSTFSGQITETAGSGGTLVKTGLAILTLNGTGYTYTGDTYVTRGTLKIGDGDTLRNTTVDLSAGAYAVMDLTLATAGVRFGGLRGSTNLAIPDGQTLTVGTKDPALTNASAVETYSGVLSGLGSNLVKTGPGTLKLTGANGYTGTTRIEGGALEALDGTGLAAGSVVLAGGVLQGTGSFLRAIGTGPTGNVSWDSGTPEAPLTGGFAARGGDLTVNLVAPGGGVQLTWASPPNSGMFDSGLLFGSRTANGTVLWTNPIDLVEGTPTITVVRGADTAPEVNMSGALSGDAGLRKLGDGTLVLSGANTYTRATEIDGGTLLVSGSLDAQTYPVNVNNTGKLAGTGAINRPVFVNAGGTLAPGGALTINGALTLAGAGIFNVDPAAPATSDRIAGLTDITFGGTLSVGKIGSGSFVLDQVFDLFDWSGAPSGTFSGITLPDLTGTGLRWSDFDYTNGQIKVMSQVLPFSGHAKWTLAGSGSWASDGNWEDTASSSVHKAPGMPPATGETASFGTVAVGSAAVGLGDNAPSLSAVSFGGDTAYTLQRAVGEFGSLRMQAAGDAPASISAAAGTKAHVIDVPVSLESNTTVDILDNPAVAAELTISGVISGDKKLTKAGTGTLVLGDLVNQPDNLYSGGTEVIEGGTLEIANAGALPANGTLTITDGTVKLRPGLGRAVELGGLDITLVSPPPAPQVHGGTAAAPVASVPEPSTLLLLAVAGLVGLAAWFRRRR